MDGRASGRTNQGSRTVAAAKGSTGNFGLKVSEGMRAFSARRLLAEAMAAAVLGSEAGEEGGGGGRHVSSTLGEFLSSYCATPLPKTPLPAAHAQIGQLYVPSHSGFLIRVLQRSLGPSFQFEMCSPSSASRPCCVFRPHPTRAGHGRTVCTAYRASPSHARRISTSYLIHAYPAADRFMVPA